MSKKLFRIKIILLLFIVIFLCNCSSEEPTNWTGPPSSTPSPNPSASSLPPIFSENTPSPHSTSPRVISFSGYEWIVKSSVSRDDPGPNYFSDSNENAWVDDQGQLHLKITHKDDRWYCAEVISKKSFGYGKYTFHLANKVDQFNENVVVGLFTWNEDDPAYYHREIDIEFSKFGTEADNSQYGLIPDKAEQGAVTWDYWEKNYARRFNLILDENLSIHSFVWQNESIMFQSISGFLSPKLAASPLIESWNYTGKDIPKPGNENARINLWLYQGIPPSDNNEAEIIIKKFEFNSFSFLSSTQ